MLGSVLADMRRGFNAPFGSLMVASLSALMISGPVGFVFAASGSDPGLFTLMVAVAQIAATLWFAGRRERLR